MFLSLLLTLTACDPSIGYQTHHRCRGVLWFGECYRDEAEKFDAQQSRGRGWLSKSLDTPIAGSAVLIVPTRDWLTQVLRDLNPGIPDPDLRHLVNEDEYGALLFAQGIEKRCIFSSIAHSTHGLREPLLGSATDPSRADAAGIQGLCPHRGEVPAPALWREALTRLAAVSKAACAGYLGL